LQHIRPGEEFLTCPKLEQQTSTTSTSA